MTEPRSQLQCPLCGENNHCTGAIDSESHQPCWCTSVNISNEMIAQIPKERLGVCICPRCAGAASPNSTGKELGN